MEIVLDKEERISILQQRLDKTTAAMEEQYNFAEAAAIMGHTTDEVKFRNNYYVLYDEVQKIKKAIADENE